MPYFHPIEISKNSSLLSNIDVNPFNKQPPEIAKIAAKKLMAYLEHQTDFTHNFGLHTHAKGPIIGKMFGVLVVKNAKSECGYLASFSGKLADSNTHKNFVPPIYDMLAEGGFLSEGMREIKRINEAIFHKRHQGNNDAIALLKNERAELSKVLQRKLFDNYNFINSKGRSKNVQDIFSESGYRNPPSAAGECAAPKLFQYAHLHNLTPLAIAEFWWGQSPKSTKWVHKSFYPACEEKCRPILGYMLN